jgi:hypothetical protein
VNGKIILLKLFFERGGRRKESGGKGEFKYHIFDIL